MWVRIHQTVKVSKASWYMVCNRIIDTAWGIFHWFGKDTLNYSYKIAVPITVCIQTERQKAEKRNFDRVIEEG